LNPTIATSHISLEEFQKSFHQYNSLDEKSTAIATGVEIALMKATCCGKILFLPFLLQHLTDFFMRPRPSFINGVLTTSQEICCPKKESESHKDTSVVYVCLNCSHVYDSFDINKCPECGKEEFEELNDEEKEPGEKKHEHILSYFDAIRYTIFSGTNVRRFRIPLSFLVSGEEENENIYYTPGCYNPEALTNLHPKKTSLFSATIPYLIKGINPGLQPIEINR
jgi:DNA-directed RNA polymerase subunit RPC12/RpoP